VTVLRVLVAIVLLLNGMAMPPATAMHMAAGAASHAGHQSPAPDHAGSHDHQSSSMPDGNCCEDMSCDCGCAVPHAVTLTMSLPRTSWRAALSDFTFVVKSFHSSSLPAPFRPPA
jgi:hypothetical protein